MKKPTVYIVDDDDATRDALRTLLTTLEVNIETFSCAEEFLDGGFDTECTCLIADVNLPGQSGVELLQRLKRLNRCVPTIILDSSGDVQAAVQAMRVGVIDFIEKPFVDRVLIKRICDVLNIGCTI